MATLERSTGSIEAMQQVLSYLVTERQHLRAHGVEGAELEANRKAIVAIQWRINRALGGADRPVRPDGS
jgi:hypothetical protein